MARWTRGLPPVLVLVIAIAAFTPPRPGAAPSDAATEQRLEETNVQLQQAQAGLQDLLGQVELAETALQSVEDRLAGARADLVALEGQLAAAKTAHDEAVKRTQTANRQLHAETQRLEEVRRDLRRKEDTFHARVAATYKHGAVSYADALVAAKSFPDFLNSYYYVRSALDYDQTLITSVMNLARQVEQRRAEVERLRQVALAQEAEARSARQEAVRLTEQQSGLVQQIAAELEQRQAIVVSLQRNREQYQATVSSLQAESDRLAEELRASRALAEAAAGRHRGLFIWPAEGPLTSEFGWRVHPIFGIRILHAGIDIGAATGQSIVAAAAGQVIWAGPRGGYGNTVVIDHGGGLATLYAHQSRVAVSNGQVVSQGDKIGEVGSTGYSTGPHLHFEVRVNGDPQDPLEWY